MSTAKDRIKEPDKHYWDSVCGIFVPQWDDHARDVLEAYNEGTVITEDPATWPPLDDWVFVRRFRSACIGYRYQYGFRDDNEDMILSMRDMLGARWWPLPGGAK